MPVRDLCKMMKYKCSVAQTTNTWGQYFFFFFFAFKNTLTTTLNHKTCINTSGQGFKKRPYSLSMLSLLVKTALIANMVFSKICPKVCMLVL